VHDERALRAEPCEPTAQTLAGDSAVTELSEPPAGCGTETTLHWLPLKCSTSGPVLEEPTAQTSLGARASTSFSELAVHWMLPSSQSGTGVGTGTEAQLVPFQCSASGSLLVNVA
jgi:hypothetical protein